MMRLRHIIIISASFWLQGCDILTFEPYDYKKSEPAKVKAPHDYQMEIQGGGILVNKKVRLLPKR